MRPSEEPPGQVAPASQDRSSQISSPARPVAMLAQAMPRAVDVQRDRRPYKRGRQDRLAVAGSGRSVPSQRASQIAG